MAPADWELIAAAEAKTNPRVRDQIGAIHLVPPARRVAGPGASWAMAPFCHISRDRPSRFSDGSYGMYYAGDRFEVALAEAVYDFKRFMAATDEEPATADYRELISRIDADLHDLRDTAGFRSRAGRQRLRCCAVVGARTALEPCQQRHRLSERAAPRGCGGGGVLAGCGGPSRPW